MHRVPAISLVVLAIATACGGSDAATPDTGTTAPSDSTAIRPDPSGEPARGGRVVVAVDAATDGWVPADSRWLPPGLTIARAIFDPLAAFTDDGDVVPYLAESIESDADFTTWTIGLREGVQFHDGSPVDATAVIANLESIRGSTLQGGTLSAVESLAALDPLTIEVEMSEPWATLPVALSGQAGFIVHPAMITGELTDPVGSGPFVFAEWVPGDHFTATANTSYWRQGLPHLDEVEVRVMRDDAARAAALATGDVQMAQWISAAKTTELLGGEGEPGFYTVASSAAEDEETIVLNSQTGPTADADLRQALDLALDRDVLNEALFDGKVVTATQSYREGTRWHSSDVDWPDADPVRAAQMIAAWEADNGPLELEMLVVAGDNRVSQYVQQVWTDIGVDVTIEAQDPTTVALRMVTGEYEAGQFAFFNAPDPDGDYGFLHPDSVGDPGEFGLAISRYSSPTLAENLDAGRRTDDLAERKPAYDAVWAELAEEKPILWLYHNPWVIEVAESVNGIETFTFPDSAEQPLIVNWGAFFLTTAWVE